LWKNPDGEAADQVRHDGARGEVAADVRRERWIGQAKKDSQVMELQVDELAE
jgi:hypothetical protein